MATAAVVIPPPARTGPPGQPDIGYTPDYNKYLARVQRRKETEKLTQTLPDGFPQKLESQLVWDGATVSDEYEWAYQLTQEDVTEIEGALEKFKGMFLFFFFFLPFLLLFWMGKEIFFSLVFLCVCSL
jgi:hypothetical protein